MRGVYVVSVESPSELDDFLKFSEKIYRKDKYWVEPFLAEEKRFFDVKNPYWVHTKSKLFLAKNKKGDILGRLGVFIDRNYMKHCRKKAGYFGFFECFNKKEVAHELFVHAMQWLDYNGVKSLRGPMNGIFAKDSGFLVDGFNMSPEPLMNYNPKYYVDLMNDLGFEKIDEMDAYKIDLKKIKTLKYRTEIKIRSLKKWDIKHELKAANYIINTAMTKNFEFIPATINEFSYMAKHFIHFIDKELVLFAMKDGKEIGIIIAVPNINEVIKKFKGELGIIEKLKLKWEMRKLKDAKVEIVCVLPEYQHHGIGMELMNRLLINLIGKGYENLEYSRVSEDNISSKRIAEHYGGVVYKKYRMFGRKIKT